MKRRTPSFCVADRYDVPVFVGDRIMWYSDSYLSGKGRVGRYVSGKVIAFNQYNRYSWNVDKTELVTNISVRADKGSYGDYDYGTIVSLRNLDNITKVLP